MKKTIMFVHGTGVRGPAYATHVRLIERKLAKFAPGVGLAQCLWGDELGARLRHEGKSIPTYGTARALAETTQEQTTPLWFLLIKDPTFELALLSAAKSAPLHLAPNAVAPGTVLISQFEALRTGEALISAVLAMGLGNPADKTSAQGTAADIVDAIRCSAPYLASQLSPAAGGPQHRAVLARALVASMQKRALENGLPMLDTEHLAALTTQFESLLGEDTRVIGTMLAPFAGIGLSLATSQARRRRTALSDAAYPAAGDVLVYLTQGSRLRDFIREQINAIAEGEVVLLAHSLGGIACVDMLVEAVPANVSRLVTFGSQAPLLYELDALTSLRSDQPLPGHFPAWSNFYDLNDPLSYIGEGVFPGKVTDYQVESGLSFPASHSAYLNNTPFWIQLAALL